MCRGVVGREGCVEVWWGGRVCRGVVGREGCVEV